MCSKGYLVSLTKATIMFALLLTAGKTYSQAPSLAYPGYNGPQNYTVGTAINTLTLSNSGGSPVAIGFTSTLAGSQYSSGFFDGTGALANFTHPYGMAIDASGNIYVADADNNAIRKVTSAGVVTTLAGSGSIGAVNGTGTSASFDHPTGVCLDGAGNLYVADDYNNMIRKIVISTAAVTTLAGSTTAGSGDGTGVGATFHNPTGIAYDGSANLYVADFTNNEIRKIVISTGVVTTFAGSTTSGSTNGNGTAARFKTPFGIAYDGGGNLYVADYGNNMIRKIVISTTAVTTLAGSTTAGSADGTGSAAGFNFPQGVAVYGSGNIYVADASNNKIRMITTSGVVTTYAGTGAAGYNDGNKLVAILASPAGLCVDASNNLYVGDYSHNTIRKIVPAYYALSSSLIQGLVFNDMTGAISGTPTVQSPATSYTITGYNSSGSGSVTINLAAGLLSSYDPGNRGFVQEEVIKVSGITTDAMIYSLSDIQKQTSRVYFDGLGRTIQTVGLQASPAGNDLIQPMAYDNLGRPVAGYLPYAGQGTDAMGSYRSNALTTAQPAFYNQTSQYVIPVDTAAHANNVYEASPLQRLLKSGMVGAGFQPEDSGTQHYKTVTYRYNTSGDGNIPIWNPDGSFTSGNYFPTSTLSVTDGKNEDNVETLVFKDKVGHTILKRQILSSGNLDTYYIYNTAGMLSYVVTPKALAVMGGTYSLSTFGVKWLTFHYVYDNMGRIVERTVPGKGASYVVYDPMNRPVLTQDSNMHASNKWMYVKYDAKGRPISTGTYTDATYTNRASMQNYVLTTLASSYNTQWYETRSTSGAFNFYSNVVFPTTVGALTFTHYDDYDVANSGSPSFLYANQGLTGEVGATTASVKGMVTVTSSQIVGSGITAGNALCKVFFYDKRGNPIQTQSNNQLYYIYVYSPTDYSTVVPDFMGVPQITKVSKQTAASTTITVQTNISYDHMYRVTGVSQSYNGAAAINVAAYSYNELGQVVKKSVGYVNSTTWLQNIDMRYNIRGQLLSINNSKLTNDSGVTNGDTNDLFGMTMLYDQVDSKLGNSAYYDGKVSAVKWMSRNASATRTWERAYRFKYDGVNRYVLGKYSERDSTSTTNNFTNNVGGFDENISYDAGGSILTLGRNSSTQGTNSHIQIDTLTYSYDASSPYWLSKVTDGTDANHTGAGFRDLTANSTYTYSHDMNGNMTIDPNEGLILAYNVLNKTDKITFTLGTNRWIDYTYSADGTLLRKRQYDNNTIVTTTDYIDGFVYTTAGAGTPALAYFPMPEGRVLNTGTGGTVTLTQEFVIGDQQGNARLSFQNNGSGKIVVKQENSYYPSGLIMPNSPVATPTIPNKQLYNGGAEWQNDFANSPDYYMTYYRNYDPALMQFIAVDPVAESAESMSTYQYANNNPIMFNDPLGNFAKPLLEPPGQHNAGSNYVAPGDGDDFSDGGGNDPFANDPDFNGSNYGNTSAIDGGDYSAFWNSSGGAALVNDVMTGLNQSNVNSIKFSMTDFMTAAAAENDVTPGQTTDLVLRSNGMMGIVSYPAMASADNSDPEAGRTYTGLTGSSFRSNGYGNIGGISGPMDCVFQSIAFATGGNVMDIQQAYADFLNGNQHAKGWPSAFDHTADEVGFEGVTYGNVKGFLGQYGFLPGYNSKGDYGKCTYGDVGILLETISGGLGHAVDITGMADPTHYNTYDPQNNTWGTKATNDSSIIATFGH